MAPKELGDAVWHLTTSLARYYDFSLNEIYSEITGLNDSSGYDIDIIYAFIKDDFDKEKILEEMIRFKTVLNRLDLVATREDAIQVAAEIRKEIARVLVGMFDERLSNILYFNIDKLRKRYPEGFNRKVSNKRIDRQSKYKEEETLKVLKKEKQQENL